MNEYTAGSIANLISGGKLKGKENTILKKKKNEVTSSKIIKTKTENKEKNKNINTEHATEGVSKKKLKKSQNNSKEKILVFNTPDHKKLVSKQNTSQKIKKNKSNIKSKPTTDSQSLNNSSPESNEKNKSITNVESKQIKKDKDIKPKRLQKEDLKVPPQKKKKIELLKLDHVPSDSEEEDAVESNKIGKPKKKFDPTEFIENTIFVGNVPINYDKQKVYKVFSKFGKIVNARIRCVPIADINMSKKVAAVKKQFNPKRNSVVAYVKYSSKDSAMSALKANGMVVDGHHLRVDLAEKKEEIDNNKAVFVGGLPFDIEDDELWSFFENCGNINSVRVVRDSQTSMGKGFGYVNFDSTAAVELALQMNGQQLKKRTLNIQRCVKGKNKNKMNTFGKKKSREITTELLAKRGKKFKAEKKKEKFLHKQNIGEFQGKKANIKEKKKKKKPSKFELRKKKIIKTLGGA